MNENESLREQGRQREKMNGREKKKGKSTENLLFDNIYA